jgi:hypothetical protein
MKKLIVSVFALALRLSLAQKAFAKNTCKKTDNTKFCSSACFCPLGTSTVATTPPHLQ